MFTVQIHRIFSIALGLTLLFSAVGSLFQVTCSLGNLNAHEPLEYHFTGEHSHTSANKHHLPCSSDPESVPCSEYAVSCCTFQAVPPTKAITALFESSRVSSDELFVPCFFNLLYEVEFRGSLFQTLHPSRCSACLPVPDRQAFLSTFLI